MLELVKKFLEQRSEDTDLIYKFYIHKNYFKEMKEYINNSKSLSLTYSDDEFIYLKDLNIILTCIYYTDIDNDLKEKTMVYTKYKNYIEFFRFEKNIINNNFKLILYEKIFEKLEKIEAYIISDT